MNRNSFRLAFYILSFVLLTLAATALVDYRFVSEKATKDFELSLTPIPLLFFLCFSFLCGTISIFLTVRNWKMLTPYGFLVAVAIILFLVLIAYFVYV